MPKKRSDGMLLWTVVTTLIVGAIMIINFSGFSHSGGKFREMLVTLGVVLLVHYLLGDPIKFALLAIDASCWPPRELKFATDNEATHNNRLDYLRLRLRSLRAQLYITEEHRDEKLNNKYRQIVSDLSLYGKYFIMVLCLVFISCDVQKYYTKKNVMELFAKNHTIYYGLSEIYHVGHIYRFIESSLIDSFSADITQPEHSKWVHGEQTMMLGVVRLRQLRVTEQHYGVRKPSFTEEKYLPGWKLPYEELPYSNEYWRIYNPWVPISSSSGQYLLMNFNHYGYFRKYPELKGYVALLARSRQNSLTVLKYLHDHKWLNYNTSAIFMDFSLYNIDSNILAVCTLRVEHTPFGSTIPHVLIETVFLVENLDNTSSASLIMIFLYVIVFIQFFKALSVRLWYESGEVREMWNKVDIGIFILNIILLAAIITREWLISLILYKIENASKMEFLELKYATRMIMLIRIIMGFLICITTLRLWKVLQFSTAFQLFTHTLFLAWRPVASTAIVLFIFIMGFASAASTINGNNSSYFYRLINSILTCMCFAFGFTVGVTPENLFYGGKFLGIILYAILTFVISVMLMNVFISLINDYFSIAKDQRDTFAVHRISIFQFIYAEYSVYIEYFRSRFFRKYYRRRNRTVSENIKRDLNQLKKYRERAKSFKTFIVKKSITQSELSLEDQKFRRHQERVYTIGAIMNTQIDILKRLQNSDKDGYLLEKDKKT